MPEEPETRELREAQQEREQTESEQASAADSDDEAAQHERRAEKAAYLRDKLQERAESEQDQD
jgi:hypothetical protein